MSCTEVMLPVFPTDGLFRNWKPDYLGNRKAGLPQMQDSLDSENYSSPGGAVIKVEDLPEKELVPKDTQYLAANCVLFTYFSGDTSSVVDEHFSRALSQASNCGGTSRASLWKEPWPMSQRNFPPSFWNSTYQAPAPSLPSAALGADPYLAGSFHGFAAGFPHPQDTWCYPSASQSRPHTFSHHRSMGAMPSVHDFSYNGIATSSHYGSHYGSLLMQQSLRPGRLPPGLGHQYELGVLAKAPESWGSRLNAAGRLATDFGASSSLEAAASGLDSNLQETSKEPYWF